MVGWRLRLFWAAVLGVAAALAIYAYLRSVAPTVDVVVARVNIPARSVISADQLSVRRVSRRDAAALLTRPLAAVEQAVGAVAVQEIPAGHPLEDSPRYLQRAPQALAGSAARLSYFLPDAGRAVTVSLSEGALVGGQVHEGDRVDVIFTSRDNNTGGVYAAFLVQGATVLRVQKAASPAGSYHVTLLVTPEQALAVALAAHQGHVDLALAGPGAQPVAIPALSPLQFLQPEQRSAGGGKP